MLRNRFPPTQNWSHLLESTLELGRSNQKNQHSRNLVALIIIWEISLQLGNPGQTEMRGWGLDLSRSWHWTVSGIPSIIMGILPVMNEFCNEYGVRQPRHLLMTSSLSHEWLLRTQRASRIASLGWTLVLKPCQDCLELSLVIYRTELLSSRPLDKIWRDKNLKMTGWPNVRSYRHGELAQGKGKFSMPPCNSSGQLYFLPAT